MYSNQEIHLVHVEGMGNYIYGVVFNLNKNNKYVYRI
jgi:hypothetical protein